MLFNVPQFTDIEDKIVGPLTAKQLGWLAGGGVILLVLYNLLDMSAFIMSAVIVGAIFGALAFYRPYNQPLIKFLGSSVSFVMRPKIYIWDRFSAKIEIAKKPAAKKNVGIPQKKNISEEKLAEISKRLDLRK